MARTKNAAPKTPKTSTRTPKTSTKRAPSTEAPLTVRYRPTRDEIAQLAYQIWEQRGHVHGHDVDDWTAAERQLAQ